MCASAPYLRFGEGADQPDTPVASIFEAFISWTGTPCQRPPCGYLSAVDLPRTSSFGRTPWGQAATLLRSGFQPCCQSRLAHRAWVVRSQRVVGSRSSCRPGQLFARVRNEYRKLLLQARLPDGDYATPITQTSPAGRQFVVIAIGRSSISRRNAGLRHRLRAAGITAQLHGVDMEALR
jgi:hypothetical protein